MARVTVKVGIHRRKPDKMINLANDVLEKHKELGENSPLKVLPWDKIQTKLLSAKEKRAEAQALHSRAEALNQEAELALGIADSQNSRTDGTIYNTLTRARDILLGIYKGQEETLSEWGFDVVSATVKNSKRKKTEKAE
jgi:hypothetical protein